MSAEEEAYKVCSECGATIYPEHLQKHVAEQVEGRLLCPYCLRDRQSGKKPEKNAAGDEPIAIVDAGGGPGDDDAVLLGGDERESATSKASTAIRAFGGGPSGMSGGFGAYQEKQYQREVLRGSPNATRCRTFHCKLADGPMTHLNEQINDWVDEHEDVEIKFATSTIGVIEGKHNDPHLIITVFY